MLRFLNVTDKINEEDCDRFLILCMHDLKSAVHMFLSFSKTNVNISQE